MPVIAVSSTNAVNSVVQSSEVCYYLTHIVIKLVHKPELGQGVGPQRVSGINGENLDNFDYIIWTQPGTTSSRFIFCY